MPNGRLYFTTGIPPLRTAFTVVSAPGALVFQTGVALRRVAFTTGAIVTVPGLLATLSDNHEFLVVRLERSLHGVYALHARREGSGSEEPLTTLNAPDVGWAFPVPVDGLWYLTLSEGGKVVAQTVALVNRRALRALARYRKRITPALHQDFERRCYYNAAAILLYEAGEFTACADTLTLLQDLDC